MGLLHAKSSPVVAPNPQAIDQVQVVQLLPYNGAGQTYQGEALRWDTTKSRTIALVFTASWYAQRQVHLFLWTSESTTLQVSGATLRKPESVHFDAAAGIATKSIDLPISAATGELADDVRIFLSIEGNPAGSVYIGLEGREPRMTTQVQCKVVPNLALAVLLATWSIVFAVLFAIAVMTGSKGALFAAPALAVLPGVLNLLGVSWANWFNVSRLARWVTNQWPRKGAVAWSVIGVPAALMMSYVACALFLYVIYNQRVESQGLSDDADLMQVAALFCDYPERLEVRALTARKLSAANQASLLVTAEADLLKLVPTARFLGECLSRSRLTPQIMELNPGHRDRALVFYAGLWWKTIDSIDEFEPAMKEIRTVLGSTGKPNGLIELTLAKFETRSVKNQNEHLHCAASNRTTPGCETRRKQCAIERDKLVKALAQVTDPADVRTVTYIEARDVAASSYMSPGCAESGPDDAKLVVEHLRKLIRAIPRQEPVLDDLLSQLNFRKFLDAQLESRPAHQTSQAWQEQCKLQADVCKLLYETFINDQKQTFFSPDREKRATEWESPSIPALKGAALEPVIERLTKKGWKWPL